MKPGDTVNVIFTREYPTGYPAEGVVVNVGWLRVRVARFVPFDGLRVKWYRKRDVVSGDLAERVRSLSVARNPTDAQEKAAR